MFGQLLFSDGSASVLVAVAIVVGLGLIYLGGLVKIRLMTIVAAIGSVASIFVLISQQIESLAVPVLLFAAGFLAIGLSILFIKRGGSGLAGLYQPLLAARLGAISDGTVIHRGSGGTLPVWIIALVVFLVLAFSWGMSLMPYFIFS